MNKTFADMHHQKHLKQNTSVQQKQQNFMQDGLFACRRQKEMFLQRLKKGTLFRLSHNLKPETKISDKDPYINWLQENSAYNSDEVVCGRAMGETFFYMNVQEVQKQKKLINPKLPAIQKLYSSHTEAKQSFHTNKIQNHSLYHQPKAQKDPKQSSKQTKNSNKTFKQRLNPLQQKKNLSSKNNHNHKHQCFDLNLSKTQLFPISMNHSFYQNRQNLIKSQFYLNDHKKKLGFNTFYSKPKRVLIPDHDLSRVDGIQMKIVNSFDSNLLKLQKQASISCYDEVSSYFSIMKRQVNQFFKPSKTILQQNRSLLKQDKTLLHQERALKKQRKTFKQKINQNSKQQKSRPSITPNRLKTLNQQNKQSRNQNNEGYLPQFLLKSLILPKNRHSISSDNIFPQIGIRS